MPALEVAVTRPQRWDAPFGSQMTEEDVDRLLTIEPFANIDAEEFPSAVPLRGILLNDTRIVNYEPGSIIVREGDYGNSAFLVLSGRVKVALDGLDGRLLGRPQKQKRGFLRSLARFWSNPGLPEVRKRWRASNASLADNRDSVDDLAHTRIFLQDVPRVLADSHCSVLHAGEIFGELAAMTRMPRAATVVADGEAQLLEIRWQGLRDLMRRTPALRDHIERLYRESSLRIHLRETPLLTHLPAEQLDAVAARTVFETHGQFEWQAAYDASTRQTPLSAIVNEPLIAEEGLPCDGLILIRAGFARLSHREGHGHRTIAYLGKGQIYGLAEAIQSIRTSEPVPLTNSLRALGYVDVLRISKEVLRRDVFPYVDDTGLEALANQYSIPRPAEKTTVPTTQETPTGVDPSLLEFLVEKRFINGREAMVIDLDRCTRCDDCVRACAATHDNNPRFLRHGQQHGQYMVAHACMHCVDPICMIGCPTGAIARDRGDGTVQINDLTCIGCSTCANSCPYDNIRMVEIRDNTGAILIDEHSRQPILKAAKCDLCAEHSGGPACQRACPHDALVRLDLGNLGKLSQWVSR